MVVISLVSAPVGESTRSIRLGLESIDFNAIRVAAHDGKRALVCSFHHSLEVQVVAPFIHRVIAFMLMPVHVSDHVGIPGNQGDDILVVPEVVSIVEREYGEMVKDNNALFGCLCLV
jgi:hypothetical protein